MSYKPYTLFSLLATSTLLVAQPKHIRTDFDTDTLMTHDPVMAVEGGIYHVFSTGNGIQHATSRDMRTWTVHAAPTLTTIPEWTHDSVHGFKHHVWAPDIIRHDNRWWLAYSCSTFGKNTSAIGLASTATLSGDTVHWKDEGALVCSVGKRDNWNAIDPNFAIDDAGNPWLVFGSFWDGIQLVRLDSTMHVGQPSNQRTIARRHAHFKVRHDGKANDNAIEAPFIYKHGGWYYLFVSWDYCCRGMESSYRVVVGRSRSIEGPYLDRDGKAMLDGGGTPVIEGDKRTFEAAGHSAAYSIDGQDWFMCHGYSIARDGASILILRHMDWTSDGWPIVDES